MAIQPFFLGTWASGGARGIYRSALDDVTGELAPVELAAEAPKPSWVEVAPGGRLLYAGYSLDRWRDEVGGAIAAFRVDADATSATDAAGAALIPAGEVGSGGAACCHLALHPSGRWIAAANYTGGNLAVAALSPDGELVARTTLVQHAGSGPNRQRQDAAHTHSVAWTRDGRWLLTADLGIDAVLVYAFDAATGALREACRCATPPGSGPRMLAWHPDERRLFVVTELSTELLDFSFDAATGRLELAGRVHLFADGRVAGTGAHCVVTRDGRFVIASNRAPDVLAVFAVEPAGLRRVGNWPPGGAVPRGFALDATDRWLVVGHQNEHALQVFAFDPNTGELRAHGARVPAPSPVCVAFVR